MTVLIQREVLSCPLYKKSVFPFLVNCGVSPFSTRMVIHVLNQVFETIEPLAFIEQWHYYEQIEIMYKNFCLLVWSR